MKHPWSARSDYLVTTKTASSGWKTWGIEGLLGAAIALGQAPVNAWYIAFPALVLALRHLVQRPGKSAAFASGWRIGFAYFSVALFWIMSPFWVEPDLYGWMAPFGLVLMAAGLALFWGSAAGLAFWLPQRVWAMAATFASAELLRGFILTGFPWALLGHMWQSWPAVQIVAFIGASGLTVLTLGVAAVLVRRPWLGLIAFSICFMLGGAYGLMRPEWGVQTQDRPVHIRLIQPNIPQSQKWLPQQAQAIFTKLHDMTAASPPAELTIWPETSLPYIISYGPEVTTAIAEAANPPPLSSDPMPQNQVIIGDQRVEGQRVWNSLRVIDSQGAITHTYDKVRLVPFGEYIPYGDLIDRLLGEPLFSAQSGHSFTAGPGPAVIDMGARLGRFQPLICYEVIFPHFLLNAPTRPDWLLQLTNDAWFGEISGPYQHFELARLRAIEMGLPLIRVANTGVSALIDPYGRIVHSLGLNVTGVLDITALPRGLPPTLYSRFKDLSAWVMIIGLYGLGVRRSHKNT